MKSLILGVTLIIGVFAFGQEAREKLTPTEKAQKKTEKLAETLDLNENQKEKILAINLEGAKEQEKLKAEMNQVKQKMKAARDKNQKEVEAILTQEQLEKLNALKAERKEKRDDKRTKGKNLRMQK